MRYLIPVLVGLFLFSVPSLSGLAAGRLGFEEEKTVLHAEISPSGPAVFYLVTEGSRQRAWTVNCTAPMRGCVARTYGAVVRLDDLGRAWLAVAAAPNSDIVVKHRAPWLRTAPLLSGPLGDETLELLSRPDTALLIVEEGVPDIALQVTGLDEVVRYLAWLQSPLARGLRDASLWPDEGPMDLQGADLALQERYRVIKLREAQSRRDHQISLASG